MDDAEEFCAWCLKDFDYEGETVMMAPAAGFYTTPGSGKNEVRHSLRVEERRSDTCPFRVAQSIGGISRPCGGIRRQEE